MKIDRRKFLLVSSSACLLTQNLKSASAQPRPPAPAAKTFSLAGRKVTVYTTAERSDYRLAATDSLTFKPLAQPLETQVCVFVDPVKTFQTHLGIGGAITDAAAETLAQLPKDKQQEVLRAYYDAEQGIGYTLARTNIHSCDFSSSSYTYINEGDTDLHSFSVEHDKQFRLPLIKQATATAGGRPPHHSRPL